jgi:hypothetical protein
MYHQLVNERIRRLRDDMAQTRHVRDARQSGRLARLRSGRRRLDRPAP